MINSNSLPNTPEQAKNERRQTRKSSIFNTQQVLGALSRALVMLNPRAMVKNPVMFVTEAGAVLTTLIAILNAFSGAPHQLYTLAVMVILWLTVMFSNFAEALAEARGKAQTDSLKRTRQNTVARRINDSKEETVSSEELREGDQVIVLTGETIPGDGEVIEGTAMVDESAITGESAPVVREAGGDRSGVVGGTRVLSDHIVVRISVSAGYSFLDNNSGSPFFSVC
jgi:K+-transporting ATPase ATPase B chain